MCKEYLEDFEDFEDFEEEEQEQEEDCNEFEQCPMNDVAKIIARHIFECAEELRQMGYSYEDFEV